MMSWIRQRLARAFLASYMLVIAVGVVTLLVAEEAVAPTLLSQHMAQMMGPSAGTTGMMGGTSMGGTLSDAQLLAAYRDATTQALLIAAVAALAAALLVSLFVSRQVVGPIRRMAGATRRIAFGHYAERILVEPAHTEDELGGLARSFNEMASSLEQTERRRIALVGDVAHELRTPIATLEGYLEGLLDEVVEPSGELWAKLHGEAGRLRRLVDDLQELSRAEARQMSLDIRSLLPDVIVQAALDRVGPQFAEKGLSVQTTSAPDLPPVQADQDRAVQVLTNLLTNALRYTPTPGRVEISVTRQADAVAFTVTDTGIGLTPEHLEHLFERFYRVDKSRSRALGGSGIGLTIARALTEAMGGQITATSAGLGQGSSFTFALPITR